MLISVIGCFVCLFLVAACGDSNDAAGSGGSGLLCASDQSNVGQTIDYAGSHGPDMVVIMGEEVVVPGEGLADAGKRIYRRFTDVFRRENGQWRHDLRHANVLRIED